MAKGFTFLKAARSIVIGVNVIFFVRTDTAAAAAAVAAPAAAACAQKEPLENMCAAWICPCALPKPLLAK